VTPQLGRIACGFHSAFPASVRDESLAKDRSGDRGTLWKHSTAGAGRDFTRDPPSISRRSIPRGASTRASRENISSGQSKMSGTKLSISCDIMGGNVCGSLRGEQCRFCFRDPGWSPTEIGCTFVAVQSSATDSRYALLIQRHAVWNITECRRFQAAHIISSATTVGIPFASGRLAGIRHPTISIPSAGAELSSSSVSTIDPPKSWGQENKPHRWRWCRPLLNGIIRAATGLAGIRAGDLRSGLHGWATR